MQCLNLEFGGQLVGFLKIIDRQESIVGHFIVDVCLLETGSQRIVSVEVELESKGTPGRHSQIAESKFSIDEVEVVVQTFLLRWLDVVCTRFLVVPGIVGLAPFHRREDMHQSWMSTSFIQNLLNAILFSKGFALADELDLQTVLLGYRFRIASNSLSQWFGKLLAIVEDANPVHVQILGHPFGIAERLQATRDDDSIIAMQDAIDLIVVSFGQQCSCHFSTSSTVFGT